MYDVIVVGARCAGAPTAMLLARKGYKVLLLDKATFPSDTISTHIVLPTGAACLKRWGLLDSVRASGCPSIKTMGMHDGHFALTGTPPPYDGVDDIIAPRRRIFDNILVQAAIDAGAELREACAVEQILMEGDRVTGVRCQHKGGGAFTEKAKIVIGADGRNSLVARTVQAPEYNTRPTMTCWYYTYWSNLPLDALMFYQQANRALGTIPTNDGQICIPVVWPHQEFHAFRSDIEGNYMKTFALFPELNELISQAKREERFVGMADVPGFFRKTYGPGWALVGDAGYHRDPMTGQGISDAFRGAEGLADAIDAGLSGNEQLEIALERNERQRDASVMPMYDLTSEWASLQPPPPEMQQVLMALHGNQEQINRFFGTAAGTVPISEFFSEENIGKILDRAGVSA